VGYIRQSFVSFLSPSPVEEHPGSVLV